MTISVVFLLPFYEELFYVLCEHQVKKANSIGMKFVSKLRDVSHMKRLLSCMKIDFLLLLSQCHFNNFATN